MAILYIPIPRSRRLYSVSPTLHRRLNAVLLVPFRVFMWTVHFTCLILATQASEDMIRISSLARGYRESDYRLLRSSTDLCLATSFLCLFFTLFGVVSGRTLRYGLANFFQGGCHGAAAVLLVVSWQAVAHVARLWHIFYVFSIIPTGLELVTLWVSFVRGADVYL